MNSEEIITVDDKTETICCNGDDTELGHPGVYFTFGDKEEIVCNYCNKKFIKKIGNKDV